MAKILVIEDNADNLELMLYLLEAFGHTPLAAHDGEEGMESAQRERPDLIVCDLQMPKVDGFEVARRLKQHPVLRSIPLVAVTAYAMVGDREKVLAAGFDGYLTKPIEPQTFVPRLEALLLPDQRTAGLRPSTAPHPLAAENTPATQAARATILVVDNTAANRQLMQGLLEPFGYRVLVAAGAREGLDLAHSTPPDLIISDVHMPELDGFDFIRMVKADTQLAAIPFIFLSSTMQAGHDYGSGLALGARKFVLRPIEPQRLLAEIEELLEKS